MYILHLLWGSYAMCSISCVRYKKRRRVDFGTEELAPHLVFFSTNSTIKWCTTPWFFVVEKRLPLPFNFMHQISCKRALGQLWCKVENQPKNGPKLVLFGPTFERTQISPQTHFSINFSPKLFPASKRLFSSYYGSFQEQNCALHHSLSCLCVCRISPRLSPSSSKLRSNPYM